MHGEHDATSEDLSSLSRLLRSFGIQLFIYGILLAAYFLLVLRFLETPLRRFFETNLVLYGFIGLGLIVAQGVVLDIVTSVLVRLFGLDVLD